MNAFKNLVILDFTRYEAGPRCTHILGLLGAYVIKVEKPYTGDEERLYPPMYNGESVYYPSINLNKHSLCLNLRNSQAQEILRKLLPHVDVVTQNFRPGTIEKMGLDWEIIHKANPRTIMANSSGFGQNGPYTTRPAFDGVVQCEAGVISSIMDNSNGIPCYIGGNPCDHMAALSFTVAILAALNQREKTGVGQYLDVDMMSTSVSLFSPELCMYGATGSHEPFYDMYPKDFYHDINGDYVCISCPDSLWDSFKRITNIDELSESLFDMRESRVANKVRLTSIIESWTKQHSKFEIQALLEAEGIGVGILKGYDDISQDKYLKETGYFKEVDVPYIGQTPFPNIPFAISNEEAAFGRAPKLGEHNRDILQRFLDMGDDAINELTASGVLYQNEHAFWPV